MPSRRLRVCLAVAAALSLAYGVFGAFEDSAAHDGPLWDVSYYRTAASNWASGADPYVSDGSATQYYYSPGLAPLIARVFLGFDAELPYVILMLLGLAGALFASIRAVDATEDGRRLIWLYAIAFGNAEVVYLLASGNLAWLSGLLQASALLAASRRRWPLFYALIGCASLLKPTPLVLLLVPFVLRALSRWALLAFVPVVVEAVASRVFWPELVESRVEAIWLGVVEPLQLRYSLAGRLSRVLVKLDLDVLTATLLAVAFQIAIACLFALYLRRQSIENEGRAFALAVVAAFSAIPRMAGYDAFVFGPAVFAAFWIGLDARRSKRAGLACGLVVFAGLLKEGLAVLPLLSLAAAWLSTPSVGPGESSTGRGEVDLRDGGSQGESAGVTMSTT